MARALSLYKKKYNRHIAKLNFDFETVFLLSSRLSIVNPAFRFNPIESKYFTYRSNLLFDYT